VIIIQKKCILRRIRCAERIDGSTGIRRDQRPAGAGAAAAAGAGAAERMPVE
jgi:hypothetical protein